MKAFQEDSASDLLQEAADTQECPNDAYAAPGAAHLAEYAGGTLPLGTR